MDGISITVCILGATLIFTGLTIKGMQADIASLRRTNSNLWYQLDTLHAKVNIASAKGNILRGEIVNLAASVDHVDVVRSDLYSAFVKLQEAESKLTVSFEVPAYDTDRLAASELISQAIVAEAKATS